MPRRIAGHVRSQIVGYLALFLALGGSAVAATNLPANTVGTKQIKNHAVTGEKVAGHTLTAANIALGTIGTEQIKAHAVTGQQVAPGTLTGANIQVKTLGTVPNAARVGGVLPSGFQRLVSGTCLGEGAISSVRPNGTVSCQATPGGTITGVNGLAGSGITGGGNSGQVSLGINPMVIQQRVGPGCGPGAAISAIGQDGTTLCQSFGSGTITDVGAGTGLSGGGNTGSVSLALASTYRLPQTCASNQLVQWTGNGWGCTLPISLNAGQGLTGGGSAGNITLSVANNGINTNELADGAVSNAKLANSALTINPGTGLTGGGSIALGGSGALSVDSTVVQHRVGGTCSSGNAISFINQAGAVGCQSTNVTQIMGGSIGTVGTFPSFVAPSGLSTPDRTESNVSVSASAVPSTARNLSASVNTAPGSGNVWHVNLRVNGSTTLLGCAISGSATSCTDMADAPSIPAGASLDIQVVGSGSPPATRITFGWTDAT